MQAGAESAVAGAPDLNPVPPKGSSLWLVPAISRWLDQGLLQCSFLSRTTKLNCTLSHSNSSRTSSAAGFAAFQTSLTRTQAACRVGRIKLLLSVLAPHSTMTPADVASSDAASLPYHEPGIITILILVSFLLLLNIVNAALDRVLYCGLLGQVLIGIAWGTPGAKWLSSEVEEVVVQLGYIGLILLVYEGASSLEDHVRTAIVKLFRWSDYFLQAPKG